jgi:hypothetical protein
MASVLPTNIFLLQVKYLQELGEEEEELLEKVRMFTTM